MEAFVFILTPLDVSAPTPHSISPSYTLQRATADQVTLIKELLSKSGAQNFENFYEAKWEYSSEGTVASRVELPESEWRYWVIKCPDVDSLTVVDPVYDLRSALHLLEPAVELGFYITADAGSSLRNFGCSSRPLLIFNHFLRTRISDSVPRLLGPDHWINVGSIIKRFETIEEDQPELASVLHNLEASWVLPYGSPMRSLAVFTVLEGVVTHEAGEKGPSISHQISRKMSLLGKLLDPPLDYAVFKNAGGPEKIWKKLYSIRSTIAHGGTPDFHSNDLAGLGGDENVWQFVHVAVRRLIRFSLENPQLMADLRRC